MPTRREILKAVLGTLPVRDAVNRVSSTEESRPVLQRVKVPVAGLDRRLDGMRVGQISDVHIGAALMPAFLDEVVRPWFKRPPELMTITGDLLDDSGQARACFEILSKIPSPMGVFYSLGNHENFSGREEIITAARESERVQLLVNQAKIVDVSGAKLHVSGVDFPVGQGASAKRDEVNAAFVRESVKNARDADFRLCLAHHPDDFDEIAGHGVELTLSGHTHGGQIAPIGPWLMKKLYNYQRGLYRQNSSHLYVSCGTGASFPLRIGVPAEVTELTLVRV